MMSSYSFNAQIFIVPGLGNSGELHWQTHWENKFRFTRINQKDWDTPIKEHWVDELEKQLNNVDTSNIILVGHSLACSTIAFWSAKYNRKIKGALLVAPSDTETPIYPPGTMGFMPMPLNKLHFPSIIVTSSDDPYVSIERAETFSKAWGSKLVNIGNAGHINVTSGFGEWSDGVKYLKELDA
jgi:predicted alpha/beta hydrolase family esterase